MANSNRATGAVEVAEEAVVEDAAAIDYLYLLLTIARILKWIPDIICRSRLVASNVSWIFLCSGIFSLLVALLSVILVILFSYKYLSHGYQAVS